jgi:molecular chaperone DnaK
MSKITAIDPGAAKAADGADDHRQQTHAARDRAAAAARSAEAALARHGDKVLAEDRAAIESAIIQLREINDGDDYAAINARSVALIQAASTLGEDFYEAHKDAVDHKPGSIA